jgi:hypothetical protein
MARVLELDAGELRSRLTNGFGKGAGKVAGYSLQKNSFLGGARLKRCGFLGWYSALSTAIEALFSTRALAPEASSQVFQQTAEPPGLIFERNDRAAVTAEGRYFL